MLKITLDEHIFSLSNELDHASWKHRILICCAHRPLAISLATCFTLGDCEEQNYLLGVCTTQDESIELLTTSNEPILAFVSEELDDSSGIDLVHKMHKINENRSAKEKHLSVLTMSILHRHILKSAIESSADILLSQRGFQPFVIKHALDAVLTKTSYIDPLIVHIADQKNPLDYTELSQREREVLELVCEGLSNREIGGELHIAEVTARQHVQSIIRKLHVRNRTEGAAVAVREHWVD